MVDLARQMEQQANQGKRLILNLCTVPPVCRACPGAYCYARNYAKSLLGHLLLGEDADDHGRLRAHLSGKRRQNTAKHLERLRQWRNEADYQNDLPWSGIPATVAAAIKEADEVIRNLVPPSTTSGT